jgi:predicted helicase
MTPLSQLLDNYRQTAETPREKGSYFEELIVCYLRNEATYRDLYSDVWLYADWAKQQQLDKIDTGIDLVAKTRGTGECHAIQCKLYPLELFQRVITVSLETMKIVKALPKLDI